MIICSQFCILLLLICRLYFILWRDNACLPSLVEVCFSFSFFGLWFILVTPGFVALTFLIKCFTNAFFYKTFSQNSFFVGLLESTSLRVGMPVEVRLPTTGSPQTPRKRDSHWEVVLLLYSSMGVYTLLNIWYILPWNNGSSGVYS